MEIAERQDLSTGRLADLHIYVKIVDCIEEKNVQRETEDATVAEVTCQVFICETFLDYFLQKMWLSHARFVGQVSSCRGEDTRRDAVIRLSVVQPLIFKCWFL